MNRTISEINEKIKEKKVVVLTAEEMVSLVKTEGVKSAASKVDVVTTGTFGPMCSSSVYLNVGHTKPKIKIGGGKVFLNEVIAYGGLAAVDIVLGATALPENDPGNREYPGKFRYGGAHVIEDLVRGKDVLLEASSYGTDCYPKRKLQTYININDINEAVLFNPRNAYQNYNVAVNTSDKMIYTYMGALKPNLGNAHYCSAGELSPLLNDPLYKTIGIGTRIFLGGGIGYVSWWGTQHNPTVSRTDKDVPFTPAGTLAVIGDLKQMTPEWIRGVSMIGYGVSLGVGIGIPIPILNEQICAYTAISNDDIWAPIVDYSNDYPKGKAHSLGKVTYSNLMSGRIEIKNKSIITASLSSLPKARKIAATLQTWIREGEFFISEPVESIPSSDSGYKFKPMKERSSE